METVEAGVVTSLSVLAGQAGFRDGVERLARSGEQPSIGLHLNLTAGGPAAPPGRVPSLVGRGGGFLPLAALAARAVTGRLRSADVRCEALAQVDCLRAAGLDPVHLDSHRHVHALPGVYAAVAAAARESGIRWIRRPVEPVRQAGRPGALKRAVIGAAWRLAARGAPGDGPAVRGIGMHGRRRYLDELLRILDDLPAGLTELVVHPGHADPAVALVDDYDAPRDDERRALLSPPLRERLRRGDLQLCGFPR